MSHVDQAGATHRLVSGASPQTAIAPQSLWLHSLWMKGGRREVVGEDALGCCRCNHPPSPRDALHG